MKKKSNPKETPIPVMSIPLLGKIKGELYKLEVGEKLDKVPPFCHILGKNGLVFKNINTGHDITRAIEEDEMGFFDEIKESVHYYYPVITYDIYTQALAFFRAVYKEHSSEGAILLLLNHNEPLLNQRYTVYIPKQEVGGASVNYEIEDGVLVDGWFLAGSIHSHPNFSASQSGIDHADELNSDGIHITLGHIDRVVPEMHQRICLAGGVYLPDSDKTMLIEMTAKTPKYNVPEEWMKKVEKKTYGITNQIGYGRVSGNDWRDNYPSHSGGKGEKERVEKRVAELLKMTKGVPINQKSTNSGKLKQIVQEGRCKILS